jgi:hypothetical protein
LGFGLADLSTPIEVLTLEDMAVGIWTGGFEGSNGRENEVLEDMRIWDKSMVMPTYELLQLSEL